MQTKLKTKLNSNAQAVLDTVQSTHNHPTALEIYEAVKRLRPNMGLASVYRILHNLVEQGYIKEIGRSEECNRYDGNVSRHDHTVCTNCGVLLDAPVDVNIPSEVLEQAALAAGIELGSYEVRLYGLCPSCSTQNNS